MGGGQGGLAFVPPSFLELLLAGNVGPGQTTQGGLTLAPSEQSYIKNMIAASCGSEGGEGKAWVLVKKSFTAITVVHPLRSPCWLWKLLHRAR